MSSAPTLILVYKVLSSILDVSEVVPGTIENVPDAANPFCYDLPFLIMGDVYTSIPIG